MTFGGCPDYYETLNISNKFIFSLRSLDMTTFNLIPRPDLETVDLEEELLVFDPIQENSHIFNQTAAQIWRLLAARTPVTDLVDYLVDHYGLPDREEIQQTVQDTLSRLERLGLVIPAEPASLSSGESNGPPAASPKDPDEAENLFLEAGRLVKKGRVDQAERVLAPFRSPAFGSPGALSNQGVSEILLGRWTEAEKPLERAYALDPDNPEIAFNLSSLRYHQGRADEALALLTRMEAGDPDNVHRLCLTGKVLTALNRLDEAREKLTRALAVDPGFLNIHTDLALVCLLQNRLEEAEDRLQAALRLGGASPEVYRLLGHLQFMRRNMVGAAG